MQNGRRLLGISQPPFFHTIGVVEDIRLELNLGDEFVKIGYMLDETSYKDFQVIGV